MFIGTGDRRQGTGCPRRRPAQKGMERECQASCVSMGGRGRARGAQVQKTARGAVPAPPRKRGQGAGIGLCFMIPSLVARAHKEQGGEAATRQTAAARSTGGPRDSCPDREKKGQVTGRQQQQQGSTNTFGGAFARGARTACRVPLSFFGKGEKTLEIDCKNPSRVARRDE